MKSKIADILINLGITALIMSVSVSALFLFLCLAAKADSYVELDEVSISYKHFFDGGHDPLITQNGLDAKSLDKEVSLVLNTDIFGYLYWKNTVVAMTDRGTNGDRGQFRLVGLNYKVGVRVTRDFNVQVEHFSKHLLDAQYAYGHFPLQNSIGFVWYLHGAPRKEGMF